METTVNRKVAIFTHFYVCNFGANLQALSTSEFLKKSGWEPIFINWVGYQKKIFGNVCDAQVGAHYDFVERRLNISPKLNSSEDIYQYLIENGIYNVILGSDAVFALDTFFDRISFGRHGLARKKSAPDKVFPNPFWLEFLVNDKRFKIAAMSVSSQNCFYQLLPSWVKKRIGMCLKRFDYISVRDEWTKKMVKALSGRDVEVTPDPVWAFNNNCGNLIEEQERFLSRMHLQQPYVLVGFQNAFVAQTKKIVDSFIPSMNEKGLQCYPLPFAFGYYPSNRYNAQIGFPLDPLDWYQLVKYSSGYIGYNMHPIIASMHNNKPCVSVDNYGINILKRINIRRSSKIFDIMTRVGVGGNCIEIRSFFKGKKRSLESMLDAYDYEIGSRIVELQYDNYKKMMNSILERFYEKIK